MSEKSTWHRITCGVLPDDGVEIDAAMEARIVNAIGEAIGPWTMIYGFEVAEIPVAERTYPMTSAPGPFAEPPT